jgi:hypothetical protein
MMVDQPVMVEHDVSALVVEQLTTTAQLLKAS